MELSSKNQSSQPKETFLVVKEVLLQYLKTGKPTQEKLKDPTVGKHDLDTSERIPDVDLATIRTIEEKLKLTFLSEKDLESDVCMANSPEVRDEFKDVFDIQDVLNYTYAVLHSPNNLEKYKSFSKINFFRVPYPYDLHSFWKLVALGTKLRQLDLLELPAIEKQRKDTDTILKKIAEIKNE